jgi:hypothetical protein
VKQTKGNLSRPQIADEPFQVGFSFRGELFSKDGVWRCQNQGVCQFRGEAQITTVDVRKAAQQGDFL